MNIKILDIKIDVISKQQVLGRIKELLTPPNPPFVRGGINKHGKQLVTTNPEFILTAQKDKEFKNIINNSWLSVADGYGIRLAVKYLDLIKNKKNPYSIFHIPYSFFIGMKIAWWGIIRNNKKLDVITDVITGTDLVPEIIKELRPVPGQAQEIKNLESRIFLLGGFGDTPRLAAESLQAEVETRHGASLQIDYSVFEAKNVINKINNFKPDILFVALNHPRAQKWIDKNLAKMPSVKLAMGVGGAFDYLSGKIKRAPKFWCSHGLEWLYRLFKQPKRLRRIWRAVVIFPWTVFKYTIKHKQ